MSSGLFLLIAFVAAIVLMIVAISKWKIHPFLAIMGVSLILAIVLGLPLVQIPDIIGKGFSSVFASIGLVIILGALIGSILEKTSAAVKLADMVVKVVGKKHPELAMLILGFIISIPVFCDSGFVITNPIRKAIRARTKASSVAMTVCLSAGLYCSHVFIPPTPGPIAAAGALGVESHLIMVVLLGTLVAIPCLVAAYFYARWIGKRVKSEDETGDDAMAMASYEEALRQYGHLPGGWDSIAPILMPILLMGLGSIISLPGISAVVADMASSGAADTIAAGTAAAASSAAAGKFLHGICQMFLFLGKPFIALTVGLLFACVLLIKRNIARKGTSSQIESFREITEGTLKTVGPILFITAAGAVLGRVIIEAGFIDYIRTFSGAMSSIGLFFPFIIAAILKSAHGSSTVAITTTAGIMGMYSDSASLMSALGLNTPVLAVLTVLAIGAGSMTVSHANDSYFWVVTNFGGIKPTDGYRTQTVMTGIMGLTAIIIISAISYLYML